MSKRQYHDRVAQIDRLLERKSIHETDPDYIDILKDQDKFKASQQRSTSDKRAELLRQK